MSGKLNQLNVSFNPTEDRLLLRVTAGSEANLSEYNLWLTRRFVRILWDVLNRMLETVVADLPQVTNGNRSALLQFQQEAALSKANFEAPYQAPQNIARPLGNQPMLPTRVQAKKTPEGHHILILQAAQGQSINLPLGTPLIHSLKKLLADGAQKAQWGLPLAVPPPTAATPTIPPKKLN